MFTSYRLYKQHLYGQKQILGKVRTILETMQRYELNRASNLVIKEFQDIYGWLDGDRKGQTPGTFKDYREALEKMSTKELAKMRLGYFVKKYYYIAT